MMSDQSRVAWVGAVGVLLLVLGSGLNQFKGVSGRVYVKRNSPVHQILYDTRDPDSEATVVPWPFTFTLDSLRITSFTPVYELQVRALDKLLENQFHPAMQAPGQLVRTFDLQPGKIHRAGDSEYHFRLKTFYPDFGFAYTYPQNQDTIPPKAPGITINLHTDDGDEVVTLRSDQPNKNRLDDVVHFGYSLEFFWDRPNQPMSEMKADSADDMHKIIFWGKEKTLQFYVDGQKHVEPLELHHFYSMPGPDTLGFTILQSFPDIAYLKAVPTTRSQQLKNPVAGVEVWKSGGYAQEIYLYPVQTGKPGGQWSIPGTRLVLALAVSNQQLIDACTCNVSISDSIHSMRKELVLAGKKTKTFEGGTIGLIACDPGGFGATLRISQKPGCVLQFMGSILFIAALGAWFWKYTGISLRKPAS